ncbi:hypothetical protein BKM31_16020 [[Actinomadura] parvosata subsp. kistnae]|uniref:Uncharacterized protein n=1 Tax=[Actinomadura] parvosata subsp. kistnae TaxID=1909395 RepID=A0A1U9ZXS9_9ACTN|nr:hypothetical protein [Nonomuraea sp. ATCC 55076]AQZ62766.1 hypothetical protein BKM31_16020 [Nonomuraea sp. ATCC 55076]
MSGFQLVASLVGSLAWPVAVVVAVVALRRPLAAAMGRAKRFEAAGVAVELAEVEQARESVEEGLAQAGAEDASMTAAEVDELVTKAARLGWTLAKLTPSIAPDVVVDRSGERPVIRSPAEDALRNLLPEMSRYVAREMGEWKPWRDPRRPGE